MVWKNSTDIISAALQHDVGWLQVKKTQDYHLCYCLLRTVSWKYHFIRPQLLSTKTHKSEYLITQPCAIPPVPISCTLREREPVIQLKWMFKPDPADSSRNCLLELPLLLHAKDHHLKGWLKHRNLHQPGPEIRLHWFIWQQEFTQCRGNKDSFPQNWSHLLGGGIKSVASGLAQALMHT